jgi:hypothetical protein
MASKTTTLGHPSGISVEIVGIERGERGRSCEEHAICGSVLQEDTVVRIRHCQIVLDDGKEESALAAYWVGDGIDRCLVGFLPRHLLKHANDYDGRLAQVIDMYAGSDSPSKRRKNARNYGCCLAVLIDTVRYGKEPEAVESCSDEDKDCNKDDSLSRKRQRTLETSEDWKNDSK